MNRVLRVSEMDNWFTVEPIDESTYAISEYKHWEETHAYLLTGSDRAVLIDSGLGVSDIRKVVESLTSLPVLLITTHAHWDHIGGHFLFQDIAVHEEEKVWLSDAFPLPLQAVKSLLTRVPCEFPVSFSLDNYSIYQGGAQRLLHDGDKLDLGGRSLLTVHTPGHSPGHCCFFEPDRGYLFSGDLIYGGCLDMFYPSTDPALFMQSVERVRDLKITRVLPGHHSLQIPVSLVDEIAASLFHLQSAGKLTHGSGVFDYGGFQLHL